MATLKFATRLIFNNHNANHIVMLYIESDSSLANSVANAKYKTNTSTSYAYSALEPVESVKKKNKYESLFLLQATSQLSPEDIKIGFGDLSVTIGGSPTVPPSIPIVTYNGLTPCLATPDDPTEGGHKLPH